MGSTTPLIYKLPFHNIGTYPFPTVSGRGKKQSVTLGNISWQLHECMQPMISLHGLHSSLSRDISRSDQPLFPSLQNSLETRLQMHYIVHCMRTDSSYIIIVYDNIVKMTIFLHFLDTIADLASYYYGQNFPKHVINCH